VDEIFLTIPGPAWGAIGVLGAALFTGGGALLGSWLSNKRQSRVDAGSLALEFAKSLEVRLKAVEDKLEAQVALSNGYRSHAHVLHDWGHAVQTPESPRPLWPTHLPQ
jgi:hypothetical protein